MLFLAALLSCSALVAAAPQVLNKRGLAISTNNRLTDSEVLAYQSKKAECWQRSNLTWPMNDVPCPIKETQATQLNLYTIAESKPKTLTVQNYCSYDIQYQHLGHNGSIGAGTLVAGGTWETPTNIGSNFKASKGNDPSRVVQVEYNIDPAKPEELWYNLSMIDCLVKDDKKLLTTDASGCVGLEAGLQFGNKKKFSFQCAPGTWCDDQAYFYFVSKANTPMGDES